MKEKLTQQDFEYAAKELGIEVAMIKAVDAVESRGSGFVLSYFPCVNLEKM